MRVTTKVDNCVINIEELPNSVFNVTIQPKPGVSISRNGLHSLEECLRYAKVIKDCFNKGA